MGVKSPHFFQPMLEVSTNIKVRKDNTIVPITRYKLTSLRLDLSTSIITIKVDFYKNDLFLFSKIYGVGECGIDTDVNGLINQVHNRITNEG